MIAKELLTKIKEIEIHTRRLLSGMLVGDSTSAVKGSGFEFDQIREYAQGDDVRFIDWHSSARTGTILVKQFMEERNRTILLVVDCSESMFFSSQKESKYAVATQLASLLALISSYGKDHVGLLLFSDTLRVTIPPLKGPHHVHTIMHTLLRQTEHAVTARNDTVCDAIMQYKKKDAIVFFISDFLSPIHEKKLASVADKHDLVVVRCLDRYEKSIPSIGIIQTAQQRSATALLSTAKKNKQAINLFLSERLIQQNRLFRKYGIDLIDVEVGKPFIKDLVAFFKKRMTY